MAAANTNLLIGILFLGGAIFNLVRVPPDHANAAFGGTIGILYIAFASIYIALDRYRGRVDSWSQTVARAKTVHLSPDIRPEDVSKLHEETRLFPVTTSFFLITIEGELWSGFRFRRLKQVFAFLWSFLFGWWALPWGPVNTIASLAKVTRGGEKHPPLLRNDLYGS